MRQFKDAFAVSLFPACQTPNIEKTLEQKMKGLIGFTKRLMSMPMPGPVSVAGVQQVFDDQGRCLQEEIEKRIRGVATNLIDYIHSNICPRVALEQLVREGTARRIA